LETWNKAVAEWVLPHRTNRPATEALSMGLFAFADSLPPGRVRKDSASSVQSTVAAGDERPGAPPKSRERSSREQFNRTVLPHLDAAYNLARWLCRQDERAEDIAQEALLRAFRYRDGLNGEDARSWLLKIVRNTFLSSLKEHKQQASHEEYEELAHGAWTESASVLYQEPKSPEALLVRRSEQRSINQCLERLPLMYREVIVLCDIEDMAYKEIAALLDVPIGTVMSRLARGRKLLATYFRGEENLK
jgi:RNA polymerase sigma factor (sigma-70 family)